MNTIEKFSVLFDFDGVVMDTEAQYSVFWHQIGVEYLQHDYLANPPIPNPPLS